MKGERTSTLSPFWIAAVGLLLANGWIGWTCRIQYDQAQRAQDQSLQLESLAEKIERLRQSPAKVEQGAHTGDALARIVETTAKEVGLNPAQIVRIDPGEPRRLADSPYLEQRTDVELREATLRNIVEFTIAVSGSETGMDVPILSLRVPTGTETPPNGEELWNAQFLLTSRIYEPKIPAASPSQTP